MNCDRCGMKFVDLVQATAHKINFRHEYKQMDPAVKARIVARVEKERLAPFIVGYVAPAPVVKKPLEIVIERFEEKPLPAWQTTPGVLPDLMWVG